MSAHEEAVRDERRARRRYRALEKAQRIQARKRVQARRRDAARREREAAREARRREREYAESLAEEADRQLSIVFGELALAERALEGWVARGVNARVERVRTHGGWPGHAVMEVRDPARATAGIG